MQPNLKGAVFSWASLTGITFSHAAAGRPCRGRAAGAPGSAGGAAEPEAPSPGGCAGTAPGWELGISGQGTPPARSWLGKG